MNLLQATLLAFAVMFMGCDRFLRGKQGSDTVVVNNNRLQCLQLFPKQMQAYLHDDLNQDGIHAMTNCVLGSLDEFQKFTPRTRSDFYEAEELRSFFNIYFLTENKISPVLMSEFMKLKVLFFGGSETALTPNELKEMQNYLELLRNEGSRLSGSWRFLLFQEAKEKVSESRMEKTKLLTASSFRELLTRMRFINANYEWENLQNFLRELAVFLGPESNLDLVQRWMPMVQSVKASFLGEGRSVQSSADLEQAINWATEAYFLALRYYYLVDGEGIQSSQGMDALIRFVDIALELIRKSPQIENHHYIATKNLDHLIDEFWKLGLLKTSLSSEIAKSTYKKAIIRILRSGNDLSNDRSQLTEVRVEDLEGLIFEYNVWRTSQRFVNSLFANRSALRVSELKQAATDFAWAEQIAKLGFNIEDSRLLGQTWRDFASLLFASDPMIWTEKLQLHLTYEADPQIGFVGLSTSNFVRTLTRLAFMGYRSNQQNSKIRLWEDSLTVDKFEAFEKHFRDFGVAIGFLDPSARVSPARRTFGEANYFPPHADGNDRLSTTELYEVLHLMMSGGRFLANKFSLSLSQQPGCASDQKDGFGKPLLKRHCVLASLAQDPDLFEGMPSMQAYIRSLGADSAHFFIHLLNMVRGDNSGPGEVDYGEVRTALTIVHYIEALMVVFDRDRNQLLDYEELKLASNRFDNLIDSLAAKAKVKLSAEDKPRAFAYLLYNGSVPSGIWEKIKYRLFFDTSKVKVDRMQILNAIGLIKKKG